MKKVAESRATPSDSPTLYPLMRLLTSVKIPKQTRYKHLISVLLGEAALADAHMGHRQSEAIALQL